MDGGDEGRLTDADVPQPYVPTRGRRAAARRAAAEEEEKRALEGGNENEEAPPVGTPHVFLCVYVCTCVYMYVRTHV
mgnify:CR=1 FL=1